MRELSAGPLTWSRTRESRQQGACLHDVQLVIASDHTHQKGRGTSVAHGVREIEREKYGRNTGETLQKTMSTVLYMVVPSVGLV